MTGVDHENPVDVAGVTDAERAALLREYLETIVDEFGTVPRLMPLDEEGKAPIIQGRCSLDSPEGRSLLVDGEEAVRQIREEGARGFAIYAGKPDHNTEDIVLTDVDDRETFPYEAFPDTLTIISGSGRGDHLTHRNAGDVENAKGKDGVDGEIRAENWFCVTPGSIHPSGGVYHVIDERPIAELADDDLPDSLRPGSRRRRQREESDLPEPPETDPEALDDETIETRLERAFDNPHDGDRLHKVYNGRYAAAGFDDRSSAEFWFANRIDSWVGHGNRTTVAQVMDSGHLQKWAERPDRSYRDSILANVGYQDWYYDPNGEGEPSPDPISALPLDRLEALDREDTRRFARKRGVDWPTTEEARQRLEDRLLTAIRNSEDVVIDAPTALGKTDKVSTIWWLDHADVTDEQPVVVLHKTREARDQAIAATRDRGGTYRALYGRHEACALAAGEHDPAGEDEEDPEVVITKDGQPASEWIDAVCNDGGVPFSVAHTYLAENNDQDADPPCCAEEGTECEAVAQWDDVPRNDEGLPPADVIHATHEFARVPGLVAGSNDIFDEQPDFTVDRLGTDRVQRAVRAFLRAVDAPVTTWEAFVQLAQHDGYGDDASAEQRATKDALEDRPDREWYLEHPDAHTLAPALAKAVWYALGEDPDANGRRSATVPHEPPRLDAGARDDDGWNRTWVTVVLDDANRIETVREAPDLSSARCVIGLDAHPTPELWQRNTKPDITVDPLLDPDERALWRRFERGLLVVQVGDNTHPAGADGQYLKNGAEGTRVVLEHLREQHGEDFRTVITAKKAEDHTANLMRGVGIEDAETMHFGEQESRNDFTGEPAGLVNGCIDPGDDYVLNLLAECGLDAQPERSDRPCTDCDGAGCHECDGTGHRRAHGREFVGPDADAAARLLASVRETHVAQGAGRYARRPDDPTGTATVFVRTDATPTGFVDLEIPGVEWVSTDLQREIITTLQAEDGAATALELAEAVSASKQHVADTLERYAGGDVVDVQEGAGEHGATLYRALAGERVAGTADLGAEEIARARDPSPSAPGTPAIAAAQQVLEAFEGGYPPPD